MSIAISSGGDFNLILSNPTARGRCPFPIQASLGSQILPGLPPPGSPYEFDVILDLLRPRGFDVAFEGAPAAPLEFDVVDTTALGSPPAMPDSLLVLDVNPPPAVPMGLLATELDLVEIAPPAEFTVASLDPPPAMPTEFFVDDTDPPPAVPMGFDAVILGVADVAAPASFAVADLDPLPAKPTGFLVADTDPPPAVPTGLFGVDVPRVAVPEGFAVQLPPVPEC